MHEEELRSIHAISTNVIPLKSEAVIPVRVHGSVTPGTVGLVESSGDLVVQLVGEGTESKSPPSQRPASKLVDFTIFNLSPDQPYIVFFFSPKLSDFNYMIYFVPCK